MTPILCVVGARPNLMKIAPVMRAFAADSLPAVLLHTGQHYDADMNQRFFDDLGIPAPDINLEVGSASHAIQTAEIMRRFEPVLDEVRPAAILVVGDVNSTIACALVAAKKGVPVVHVEAGLRSFDRSMPEEINRVLTDQISDLLFTTERHALDNLRREGIDPERVHFVGNVMIDTLYHNLPKARPVAETLQAAGLDPDRTGGPNGFALLTLHRPSNVDDRDTLARLVDCFNRIADRLPLVFPVHPRTRGRLDAFGLQLDPERVVQLPPLGYPELLGLMRAARVVLTDSGGIQEETTALGIPCITLRDNTERPITVTEGTNTLVGNDPGRIHSALNTVLVAERQGAEPQIPEYWDGRAAERISAILRSWL